MRVYVEKDRSRLRIRIVYQGKKHQFSTGLTDSKTNRAYVQGVASKIQLDMLSGQFDHTMVKYRPQLVGSNPVGVSCALLFHKFTEARKSEGLSNGALEKYKAVEANLERYLKGLEVAALSDRAAGNFVAALLERVSNGTARQYLYLLRSAWDWGKGQYPVKDNPWSSQIGKVKPCPRKKRKPFSEAEIQAILKGFREHRYYRHYYPFVVFQLNCGTRPGESSSLIWGDISKDFSTALIRRSHSRGTTRQKTKTGVDREIDLNSKVQALLKELQSKGCESSSLIFTAPKGGAINDRLFCRRAWRTVLDSCEIEYRPLYSLRHTCLSHGYTQGADPLELSRQAGNSLKTMQDCYLSSIQRQQVFMEF